MTFGFTTFTSIFVLKMHTIKLISLPFLTLLNIQHLPNLPDLQIASSDPTVRTEQLPLTGKNIHKCPVKKYGGDLVRACDC